MGWDNPPIPWRELGRRPARRRPRDPALTTRGPPAAGPPGPPRPAPPPRPATRGPRGRGGIPTPVAGHLLTVPGTPEGSGRLAQVIGGAQRAGKKRAPPVSALPRLAKAHDGHWAILTGCRKGSVPAALAAGNSAA